MLLHQSMAGSKVHADFRQRRKLVGIRHCSPPRYRCAEGTLKLVIAKAMTKLDGAPAESSAVHRQSFRAR